MADVFNEVDEQLRAERLNSFMRRAVPAFIGTAILTIVVVIVVWGVQAWQSSQSAKASLAYAAALDTEGKGDDAKAFTQFEELAKSGGAYQPLALMQQGGIRMDQNKPAEAAALFEKAAAASKSPMVSDVATLKWAYAMLDTATLDQISAKLTPLTDIGRPYAIQAREALAMAKLAAGKGPAAKADLQAITLLQDAPDSARERARAIVALIDSGTGVGLKALSEAAKTAAPIQLTPVAPPQGPAGAPPQGAPQVQPEAAQ